MRTLNQGAGRLPQGAWLLAVLVFFLAPVAGADETKQVLVIYSSNRLLPANIAIDAGLGESMQAGRSQNTRIFSEFLDAPEFGGAAYELTVANYLRDKYAVRQPDAVVAAGDTALQFLLRFRADLFSSVPIIFCGVTQSGIQSIGTLPRDVVGVPVTYDMAGTASLAFHLHPRATRLVVVVGASKTDEAMTSIVRSQLASVPGGVKAEYWVGLKFAELQQRLRELNSESVVLAVGMFLDGDGHFHLPRDSARLIAEASAAPVYTPFDTFLGTGVVGGRMLSYAQMGREGGLILGRLFSADPNWRSVPRSQVSVPNVDWRQIKSWEIDPTLLPPDTVVLFRVPTLWQAYRNATMAAGALILLLAALVAWLLLERRRRRTAEIAVQNQHVALAHASRLAVAGELTAAIAHEINQPLGAVQTNADTAELILEAGGNRGEDLLRLVRYIRSDISRASDVIRRLRALLAKHEVRRQSLDLNAVLSDVEAFLKPELGRRQIALVLQFAAKPAWILGDATQIQQVLINLILNAMEALAEGAPYNRSISARIETLAEFQEVSVIDRGPGFADTDISKLFESFFSTKRTGMGLGLSIARTIVEGHGGAIRASRNPDGGAIFAVRLPAQNLSDTAV